MKIKDFKRKIELESPETVSRVAKDLGYQIGKRVELARILKGLTQTELADRIGTNQSSISRIESGASLPSLSFLMKVADALEATLSIPEFSSVTNLRKEDFSLRAYSAFNDAPVRSFFYPDATINNGKVILS
jgi:transcriptional regulator with XRE-family HTH domain